MSALSQKMLPVLDGAVGSGALSRDEAISVLDHLCSPDRDFPDREYAERLMRAYWQQRPEGRAMSDTAWVPTTEIDRMIQALQEVAAAAVGQPSSHGRVRLSATRTSPTASKGLRRERGAK